MSGLYNMVFGENPFSRILLGMLKLDNPDSIPRYRDCFLLEDGNICIYTRTGGGNRPDYVEENNALRQIPGYVGDEDDKFDNTYALFRYIPALHHRGRVKDLIDAGHAVDPAKRWDEMIESLKGK